MSDDFYGRETPGYINVEQNDVFSVHVREDAVDEEMIESLSKMLFEMNKIAEDLRGENETKRLEE
jgi:hypothetical protein